MLSHQQNMLYDKSHDIDWLTLTGLSPYLDTVAAMEQLTIDIANQQHRQSIWFLEHPPLYTLGTSAKPEDVRDTTIPCYQTGRGGQVTYHGPGQRVVYVMLDLHKHGMDIRLYIRKIQNWIIASLEEFGIKGWVDPNRIGIWIHDQNGCEVKIAAIGVRVKKWITYHGFAINVSPDLGYFNGIVPCGLSEYGVTSLKKLGIFTSLTNLDIVLRKHFNHFLNH